MCIVYEEWERYSENVIKVRFFIRKFGLDFLSVERLYGGRNISKGERKLDSSWLF